MVKDYKQIPTVDFEVQDNDDAGSGYSDVESSGDEANVGNDQAQKKTSGAFDFDESIPTGERHSYVTIVSTVMSYVYCSVSVSNPFCERCILLQFKCVEQSTTVDL